MASGTPGATLSATACTTAAGGVCSVAATANALGGTYTVTASVGAALSTGFTLTNTGQHSWVVTVTSDTTAGVAGNCVDQNSGSKANCSLRDALAAAASVTSAQTATVTFAQKVASTIFLVNGTLNLPSYTTVQGATSGGGATLTNLITVDGNSNGEIFTEAAGVLQAGLANLTYSSAANVASAFGPYFYYNTSGLDTTAITGQSFGTLLVITPENNATLNPLVITNPGKSFTAVQTFPAFLLANSYNVYGATAAQVNLGPLANNGGPTQTMLPLAGSAALCTITPSTATGTDQRGQPRVVSYGTSTCQDAGAAQTSF